MRLKDPSPNAIVGRTVIVTGAANGIGRALASGYARDGALVVAVDRDEAGLASLAGERIETVVGDVTDATIMDRASALAVERTGRVDVLVSNAGFGLYKYVEHLAVSEFEAVIAVHVLGTVYGIRAVAAPMRKQRYGRIISIVSRAAERAMPGGSAYGAAKAAQWAVSRSAAAELGEDGVLVNCLIPGPTDTGMWGRPRPDLQPPEAVYPTALALATLPPGGPNGRTFWNMEEYPLYEVSLRSDVVAKKGERA